MGDREATGPDPHLAEKLRESLAKLPKQMQELFVERLVAAIADPESFKKQVDAVTALATEAAEEAQMRMDAQGGQHSEKESLPLATAVLGAFLTKYGSSVRGSVEGQNAVVPMQA